MRAMRLGCELVLLLAREAGWLVSVARDSGLFASAWVAATAVFTASEAARVATVRWRLWSSVRCLSVANCFFQADSMVSELLVPKVQQLGAVVDGERDELVDLNGL